MSYRDIIYYIVFSRVFVILIGGSIGVLALIGLYHDLRILKNNKP